MFEVEQIQNFIVNIGFITKSQIILINISWCCWRINFSSGVDVGADFERPIIIRGKADDLGGEPLSLSHESTDKLIWFNLLNTDLHDSLIIVWVMEAPSEPSLFNSVITSSSMLAVRKLTSFTGLVLPSLARSSILWNRKDNN